MTMKTIISFLPLFFCATLFAQNNNTSKKESSNFAPFTWYQQQKKRKETVLKEYFRKNLEDYNFLAENKKVETVDIKMPIYPIPTSKTPPMPVISPDNTTTYYLKVYPDKE